eukprot:9532991-Karenia_brevis.AAC.1
MSLPKPFIFNYEIGIDVLDFHDAKCNLHMLFNMLCHSTNFQIVTHLREGWPANITTDRGLNNRGGFARLLGAHGSCIRNIALESPE